MNETILDLIQIAEKEIRRDANDLTRLKMRYPGYDFVRVAEVGIESTPIEPRAARSELSRLETAILGLIDSLPAQEWTSRSVVTAISLGGLYQLPERDDAAMNAVASTLIALKEKGKIFRIHEGKGRDPHRYISIKKEDKAETLA